MMCLKPLVNDCPIIETTATARADNTLSVKRQKVKVRLERTDLWMHEVVCADGANGDRYLRSDNER